MSQDNTSVYIPVESEDHHEPRKRKRGLRRRKDRRS